MAGTSTSSAMDGVDLTDLDNFADGFPHELFALHRREAPVWWHPPTEHTPDGEGFWSVATHAETLAVLRDPATYSSETGGDRPYGGTLIQDLPVSGQVLNMMDDPRHARIRRLVSTGLTPRMIRRIEDDMRARTRFLLDDVEAGAPFDFLREVAAELPMQMICVLLGVPEADRHWLFEAVEPGFDFRGSRESFEPDVDSAAMRERMMTFGFELIAEKRRDPGDDMLSIVANATLDDADPPQLTDGELYMFFSLLFSAGSDTTRNAIAGGVNALAARPEQYERLRTDPTLISTAVEESVRWSTPSPAKRRTATRPTELRGMAIAPGDKVVVWEGSANRDEAAFVDADRFDISRDPNPHVGFGHGLHYCLGANLARLEIRVMFEELLSRFSRIEVVTPVEWTRSNRHTGIRHLILEVDRADLDHRSGGPVTPARTAGEAYIAAVNAVDLDQLVALFAPDAVVHHPLGTFEGEAAIREFYGTNILAHAPKLVGSGWVQEGSTVVFELEASTPGGSSHAIDHCTVDDDGRIARMAIAYR